jgi:hypothetical protein
MPPNMKSHMIPRLGAVLAIGSIALAGCGGSKGSSNSIESKSANDIIKDSQQAADNATSVHVSGQLQSEGKPITLDLNLVAGKGARGEISQNGLSFKLILVGNTAYISGSPSFYRSLGGSAAAQLFDGKWLKASASSGDFASFGQLGDMRKLIDTTLTGHGTLKKGSTSTVGSQKAIAITDTTKGGTLYVATTGQPYPLQISKTGSESGKITFEDWNKATTITAPANAVDLSELKQAAGN